MERKLTAIMFTDIVGYSRIMSSNEKRGLELLTNQDDLLLPIIKSFNGKILKRMGDALFVDFSSSINAVECAISLQNILKDFNDGKEIEHQLLLRIGLHIGDVLIKGDDLFGEGINVAARLEPLADPGGICMSQAVYDSVKVKSDFSAILVGDVALKNILAKYTVYKIPSFYAEDYIEPLNQNQKNDFQINYKINNIKKLPVPSRSILNTSLIVISSYVMLLLIVMFFTFVILKDNKISKSEIINPKRLIVELKEPNNKSVFYVKELLHKETRSLIDSNKINDMSQDSINKIIRKDLNHLISNGSINYNSQIIKKINLSDKLKNKIKSLQLAGESSLISRLLLGQIFYGSIKENPESSFEVFFKLIPSIISDIEYIIFNIILILMSIYCLAFKSIKINFNDIRDVDKVLEYFVEQMGFKTPVIVKRQLIFKPTLFQIFLWGSSSIKARIDGNSIYLIGNIPIIRKLEKMFKSYEV